MANLNISCLLIITLFISSALPSLQLLISSSSPRTRSFSLQLHLQPPSSSIYHFAQQPLTPFLFADAPLSSFDAISQDDVPVGSAHGLYLADPAASMQLRYIFCTMTLPCEGSTSSGSKDGSCGSVVLMGSLDAGAIAVIGGTGSFAFASGQAQVSMAAAGVAAEQLSIHMEVELQALDEQDEGERASI